MRSPTLTLPADIDMVAVHRPAIEEDFDPLVPLRSCRTPRAPPGPMCTKAAGRGPRWHFDLHHSRTTKGDPGGRTPSRDLSKINLILEVAISGSGDFQLILESRDPDIAIYIRLSFLCSLFRTCLFATLRARKYRSRKAAKSFTFQGASGALPRHLALKSLLSLVTLSVVLRGATSPEIAPL